MRKRIAVTYTNLNAGMTVSCGDQHVDCSVPLIRDWIATNAGSGDLIKLDGRTVLVVQDDASG